ncbi:Ribosomal protein S16 domain [Pseudocohnilembus persalinus]|uniref:Ribosomal protein S16 domain n=1 Tax=Pseudocohnilembus persalinus TaxID=266149 RepID=A0A0V0QPC2_PSEPJ|nr:Ribosomal protein S16 domain [Pseudocohnilembus persalinus]|eukprot:KRX04243.1 Ribosomal protein S16 domain [Pseudocohnilembus persalinus]
MSVVLRLQNHGFKNHPYWQIIAPQYIVAAPKYSKLSGKYLEQVGYWIPRKGKTFDRQIIINKHRAQYWLAMGAEPTPKVAKFLNHVDMWPSPKDLSLLRSSETDDIKNSDNIKDVQSEIEKLKEKLNEINGDLTKLDETKQTLIVNRINDLYKSAKEFNAEYNGGNIKQRLDSLKIQQKFEGFQNLVKEHQQMMRPISRDEFKMYLMQEGKFNEIKAETLTRQTFRTSRDQGLQVLRQHAYELIQPKVEFQNIEELLQKKAMELDDKTYVPASKPVTPFPNLSTYDAEDYYEIPKMVDPYASQNKPYDLPNINDVHIPVKEVKLRHTPKNVKGRKRPPRLSKTKLFNHHMYEVFSTYVNRQNNGVERKNLFKGLHIPQYALQQFKITDLQNIEY